MPDVDTSSWRLFIGDALCATNSDRRTVVMIFEAAAFGGKRDVEGDEGAIVSLYRWVSEVAAR